MATKIRRGIGTMDRKQAMESHFPPDLLCVLNEQDQPEISQLPWGPITTGYDLVPPHTSIQP